MSELINDVFNSFYAKIRKDAALLHVQMLELHGATPNCCSSDAATVNTNDGCNMNTLKELEERVMEIVKGLEQRLENSFKQRFEHIEKTLAALLASDESDAEHAQVVPCSTPVLTASEPAPVKVATPRQALPIPSKEVSPLPSEASEEEAEEENEKAEEAEEEADNDTVGGEEASEAQASEEEAEEEADNDTVGGEGEEAEEESELTEFQFRGKTYYLDNENNVYGLDADGELIQEPVGVRDDKTGRIKFTVSV